ncbi:hypothetical protein ACHAP6_005204 [Verticillium nonalfalfae]
MSGGQEKSPIAIIGMSCRVAGADSPSQLWDVLASSKDVQSRTERFNSAGFYRPDGSKKKGVTNVDRGYFMQGDVSRFDNLFFSIPPLEAEAMDPQQRMLLELTYEAVENAGLPLDNFTGSNTAVYTGMTWNDYAISLFRDVDATPKYMSTGACSAIAANRVSYFFDLHGPSLVLDTACSSTMYALHHAVAALHAGEAEMAVVNGSNLILNPDIFVAMSEMDFLSPTGRCRTFDAAGDGYVRAEGVLALLLKPLDKALQDGDPIRAVVRGTRVNQDGRTQGLTLPSSEAQRANMQGLYAESRLDPADVQYFEAHGTGTAAGDPLEVSAIDEVYGRPASSDESQRPQKLVVGSVKSNVGHLEAAAALAGLVKTVEALERGFIPPQMHFTTPNPKIDFTRLEVPTSLMPWPKTRDGVRRAAINSFGFGGSNGHAVLEHYDHRDGAAKAVSSPSYDRSFLFKISANNDASLTEASKRLIDYIARHDPTPIDLAHTLLARRSTHKRSIMLTASSTCELAQKLADNDVNPQEKSTGKPKRVAFIFTGQGAQCLDDGPSWSAMEELSKPKQTSRVYESALSQPLCAILQIGLVELWRSWGVSPVAVVGHSSGEIGAAYCAGIMPLRDCVIAAYYRGLYLGSGASEKQIETESAPELKGSMCAVGLGEDAAKDVLKAYPGRLALAAVNSPSSCTLSGDEDAILEVVESCKANGTFCRQLRVDMAYHSHHMLPKAPKYEAAMVAAGVGNAHADDDRAQATSGCRMFSSVRGREVMSRDLLSRHAAIDALVELGPHPALKGPVQDTLASLSMGELPYFSSLLRGEPDFQALLSSAGSMALSGLDLDLVHINAFESVVQDQTTVKVKGYAWDHSTSFWAESRISKNYRLREHPRHDLLGARKSSDNPLSMSWRNLISPKEAPWLAEWINQPHATVLPWSMHVLMAVEAARQASSSSTDVIRIERLNLHQDLLLSTFTSDDTVVEFHFNLHQVATAGSHYTFSIEAGVSAPGAVWTKLSSGSITHMSSEAASLLPSLHAFNPGSKVRHDERGLKRAQSFPVPTLERTSGLQFNSTEAAALLSDNPLGACSPLALDAVLRLPTLMLLGAPLPPSQYRLRSIQDIEVSTRRLEYSDLDGHEVPSIVTSSAPINGIALANAKILAKDGETLMDLRNAEYVAVAPLLADPALESLFFQRKILPDITYAGNSDLDYDSGTGQEGHAFLSLTRFFELLTHKWPMSDLAIDVGNDDGLDSAAYHVASGLRKLSWSTNRSRFRSLTIVNQSIDASESGTSVTNKWPIDNRLSVIPSLDSDPDAQFHAVFTLSDRYESALSRVHPSGFICLLKKTKSEEDNRPDSHDGATQFTWPSNLEPVYSVQSKEGWDWIIGRRRIQKSLTGSETDAAERSESTSSRIGVRVFAPAESLPRSFRLADSHFEVQDVSALRDESLFSEPFDAIILDTGDSSILLRDAAGPDESLTWTQSLVGHVQTLVWVSSASTAQPFNGVDGAFIRTLATENPRFRGVSIAVSKNVGDSELEDLCSQIYERTRDGDAEVELYIQDGAVHCLRYHPDDELSASVDLVPATRNSAPHGFEYKINGVGNGRVEMITTVPSLPNTARACGSEPLVSVLVEVSLVGGEDVAKIHGTSGPLAREGLAAFFIGRTLETSDPDRPYGNRVFGWCSGAHASTVYVHTSQMIHLADHVTADDAQHGKSNLGLVRALGRLASQATAACLVAFEGRVRQNDRIRANELSAAIRIAVTSVAARNSAMVVDSDSDNGHRQEESAHDLEISYDGSSGFLVNGRHVRLASVLERYALTTVLAASAPLDAKSLPETEVFGIQDFAEAFDYAAKNPLSTTILRHAGGLGSLNTAWITPRTTATTDEKQEEEQLFRGDGAYIVLGGLGGLGRHLLPWMVKNGAKHVVALGRKSPLSTDGTLELTDRIAGLGGRLSILQADGSQTDEVEAALAQVRTESPIRGIINMAMVLADRPFATMSAEEWHRSIQAKVHTSWNLHGATLQDDLDIFVLFSSVVSMTGNRMQANYAVGNAFQNRLAAHRRSLGLTGVSLALPPMHGVGILAGNDGLLEYFDQAGLAPAGPDELTSLMKAAVYESRRASGASFIGAGLQMFNKIDGIIQAKPTQTQMFWVEQPEFSFLMDHQRSSGNSGGARGDEPLRERVTKSLDHDKEEGEVTKALIMKSFLQSLANLLGYTVEAFDPRSPIAAYGLDSLNAVACRYWFFKELAVDVPVFDILGCRSILELVARVFSKLRAQVLDASAPESSSSAFPLVKLPDPRRLDPEASRPLSYSQQRLWFLHNFLSDKTAYNLLLVCHIDGTVRSDLLRKTWEVLLHRHEVLRTRFIDTPKGQQQVAVDASDTGFQFTTVEVDSAADDAAFDAKVRELEMAAQSYNFDISRGELVRCWLLVSPSSSATRRSRLFLASHHLPWDRTSTAVVFDEITTIYKSLLRGEAPQQNLEPPAFQFADYASWQRQCIDQDTFREPLVGYWQTQLEGAPDAVSLLPLAHADQRPPVKQLETGTATLRLSKEVGAAIKTFCAAHAMTPFMFMTAAVAALFHRLTGDEDVVIGVADGDRGHSAFDRLVGFAVNMLPIRSRMAPDMRFLDHLDSFREACLGAYAHRSLPFDYLVHKLAVPRSTAHGPIFQITVNYVVHGSFATADFGDFKFVEYDHFNARSQSDVGLDIEEAMDGALNCVFEFDTALYSESAIEELARMYENLMVHAMEAGGETALRDVRLASREDDEAVAAILRPRWDADLIQLCEQTLFPQLFDESVKRYAHKIAVVDETTSLTYLELDQRVNAIAHILITSGAQPGEAVGVYIESGVDLAVAIYGIWRAGCAFVAIHDVPEERLRSMIEDVDLQRALVDATGREGSRAHELIAAGLESRHVHRIDQIQTIGQFSAPPQIARPVRGDDPLCCIFTSGSTGRPKGLFLSHLQLRMWYRGYYETTVGISADATLLLASVPTFDMSLVSLFSAPACGGTLVVASREARYSPSSMMNLILANGVTSMTVTPSQLGALLAGVGRSSRDPSSWPLRSLVLGGEVVPAKVVRDFFALGLPFARLWNGYGPSETALSVSLKEITKPETASRLAPPHFPATLRVVDDRGRPAPFGVPGELYIGGPGVCEEYVRRPEMTAAAFIPDANDAADNSISRRLYRTGDLFIVHRDGTLSVKGRIGGDRQVKIRGMRTELGEIETAIWAALEDILPALTTDDVDPVVVTAVAVVYRPREQLMAAYLVAAGNTVDDMTNEDQQPKARQELARALRFSLRAVLPVHMNPGAYEFLEEMPSSSAGKTDYKSILALPPPVAEAAAHNSSNDQSWSELSGIQQVLAEIWREALVWGVTSVPVAPVEDFFAVGGHSLALVNVQNLIEDKWNVSVALADLFAWPSLQGMERLVLDALASLATSSTDSSPADTTAAGSDTDVSAPESDAGEEAVDWKAAAILPFAIDKTVRYAPLHPPTAIILTGASSMFGIHLLHHLLSTTSLHTIFCIAEPADSHSAAVVGLSAALKRYNLADGLGEDMLSRVRAFPGSLSHPTLGLSEDEIHLLDRQAHAIFHLASDVSLLGNFDKVRAGNLGPVHFLIGLAQGLLPDADHGVSNVKALHYLSTWGVPHLQAWHDTDLSSGGGDGDGDGDGTQSTIRRSEEAMTHMVPGKSGRLAYLKCRWAAELLLESAAVKGLPVSIFRPSMTAPANAALPRDDINRRIIEASLQTGKVPRFGGGMGWLTADFLAAAVAHLAFRQEGGVAAGAGATNRSKIWHFVPEEGSFHAYANLDRVLETAHGGGELRVVEPREWFATLRASRNPEMILQAAVLDEWYAAGWVPFELDARRTLDLLAEEAHLRPRTVDRRLILDNVVGHEGF